MKTIILCMYMAFVIINANAQISGKWNYSDTTAPATNFDLELFQNDNRITGNHCSVMFDGDFIDCELPGEYAMFDGVSITGTIVNNIATVTFKSTYSPRNTGIAEITKVNDNQITWKIIVRPSEGCFIPDECILTKNE